MELAILDEVIGCLPRQRTLYHYYPDRYALQLLGLAAGKGCRIEQLRRGPFGALLEKPAVKRALAAAGKGELARNTLEREWPAHSSAFLLTLGRWGGEERRWQQTSRPGYNLVLRLNFNQGHDETYRKLIGPGSWHPFNYFDHPVLRPGERERMRETLAWARIDLDLERGEALIEEVQSDWVRRVAQMAAVARSGDEWRLARWCCDTNPVRILRYAEEVFAPYGEIWDQAMLSAAITFIRDELGIGNIWYHTWEGGNALKGLRRSAPPRSLYHRLPRRFCFQESDQPPGFLATTSTYRRVRRRAGRIGWYRMVV